eukprot:1851464-Rhodomonas_salina.1
MLSEVSTASHRGCVQRLGVSVEMEKCQCRASRSTRLLGLLHLQSAPLRSCHRPTGLCLRLGSEPCAPEPAPTSARQPQPRRLVVFASPERTARASRATSNASARNPGTANSSGKSWFLAFVSVRSVPASP